MNSVCGAGGTPFKAVLTAAFLILFLSLPARRDVYTQTLELAGGLDAMYYNKTLPVLSAAPVMFITGRALLEGYLGGIFTYNLDFLKDTVFDYMFRMRVGIAMKHLTFGLGYHFSSEDWQFIKIDRGISGEIALTFPDIFFLKFAYASSLSAYVVMPGNRTLHYLEAELGFWLYHMLLSARLERRESAGTQNADFVKTFSHLKAFTRLEIYGKNAPFTIRFEGGIFSLAANYENNAGENGKDESFFVFGGGRLSIHFSKHFTWFAGGDFPVRISGGMEGFVLNAETGMIITILSR